MIDLEQLRQLWHAASDACYPALAAARAADRAVLDAEDAVEAARAAWMDERDDDAHEAAKAARDEAQARAAELWRRFHELSVLSFKAYVRWADAREGLTEVPRGEVKNAVPD